MGAGEDIRAMLDSLREDGGVHPTPVERLLLATDGTVTHMLEALTNDTVEVDIIDRTVEGASLHREVCLRRANDPSPLVWARSEVNLYPLDDEMADTLVAGDVGIGDLLRDKYAETRREIISMRSVWRDDDEIPDFISGGSVLFLKRTYAIYSDDHRLMEIEEWFPKGIF